MSKMEEIRSLLNEPSEYSFISSIIIAAGMRSGKGVAIDYIEKHTYDWRDEYCHIDITGTGHTGLNAFLLASPVMKLVKSLSIKKIMSIHKIRRIISKCGDRIKILELDCPGVEYDHIGIENLEIESLSMVFIRAGSKLSKDLQSIGEIGVIKSLQIDIPITSRELVEGIANSVILKSIEKINIRSGGNFINIDLLSHLVEMAAILNSRLFKIEIESSDFLLEDKDEHRDKNERLRLALKHSNVKYLDISISGYIT